MADRHTIGQVKYGRGEQIRTADPWPPMPVRYQAAPRPECVR